MNLRKRKNLEGLSDAELIARYRKTADLDHVAILFLRYKGHIVGSSMKYLKDPAACEDAVADMFLRLIELLLRYEVAYFPGWLHQVVKSHCLAQRRKHTRRATTSVTMEELEENLWKSGYFEHLNTSIDFYETKVAIRRALAGLKSEQRICIEKRFFEGKSYKVIAEEEGFELKTIKSYMENGKKNLRKKLAHLKE